MELRQTLATLLADRHLHADPSWVLSVTEAYPTFYLPALLLLQRNPQDVDADTLQRLHALVALNCPDREALAEYVDISGGDWANLFPAPEKPKQKTTEETITDFISKYGHSSENEVAVLENLIFNPVPQDYFQVPDEPLPSLDDLAPEAEPEPAPQPEPEPQHVPIPQPEPEPVAEPEPGPEPVAEPKIEVPEPAPEPAEEPKSEPKPEPKPHQPPKPHKTDPEPENDEPMMVSLAKMYIKQKKYSRAYEIISTLSLKYPEKSVYFADQLRFLRKLILIQEHNN